MNLKLKLSKRYLVDGTPYKEDTIAAISTPLGEGGIGIVRLSGPKAIRIADKLFKGKNGIQPTKFPSYTIHYGHIVHKGEILDEVILSIMRKPKSYTREDIVEINCHSGIVPLRRILNAVLYSGARIAERGEFTKRAFLNGRINLSQAEAVLDIVQAKTDLALRLAVSQLEGELSGKVRILKEETLEILTCLEAGLDFPEDVETIPRHELLKRIKMLISKTQKLLKNSLKGEIFREGVSLLIVGKANVGKSTILNRIIGKERAIVTDIPGTTRDSIEEWIDVGGVPVKIIDTAGFKKIENIIDKEAQKRMKEYLKKADIILFIIDGSSPISSDDRKIAKLIKNKKYLPIINKIDLPQKISTKKVTEILKNEKILRISALKRKGINSILGSIKEMVLEGKTEAGESSIMINARHREYLNGAYRGLKRALKGAKEELSEEFIASDLKGAIDSFGAILGEAVEEDILKRIFEKFCIGK